MSEIQEAQVDQEALEYGSLLPAKSEPMPLERKMAAPQPTTFQQARVDSVSNLLHKAYERTSTLDLTPDQVKALKADFPDEAFKLGAGGNPDLLYIEHAYLRDRFDDVIGMGQWAVVRSRPHWGEDYTTSKGLKAVRIYADCVLLIKGCLMSEAIGEMTYFPNNPSQSYGDAAEGSETAAFRRCAKKIGVGLQAWKKDFCVGWMQRHQAKLRGQSLKPSPPPAAKPPPPAPAAPPTPAAKPPETAEEKKTRWLGLCVQAGGGNASFARELFIEAGWIMDNEQIEAISDTYIPKTRADAAKILDEIKARAGVAEPPPESGPAEMPDNETRLHVDGVIDNVSKKEGTNKKGKPWTLYGIKVGEAWYNTFDTTIGNAAHEAKGKQARVFYEQTERGMNCIALLIDGVEYPTPEVPV